MSGFFDSLVSSFNSTRSRSDSAEMAKCYNLYVHHNESLDIDDDILEPPAFQIPTHMKWRDIHGLVVGEIGCGENTEFSYMDDENDEVRINSQEEYETALHICRKEHRDLHIYNIRTSERYKGRRKKKSIKRKQNEETKQQSPGSSPLVDGEFKIPTKSEETVNSHRTQLELLTTQTPESPQEGAVGGVVQMDEVSSTDDQRETKPLPPCNSILSLIRKETRQIVADEVNDIWAFVNALKRDFNAELDDIQERLAAQTPQMPTKEDNQSHPDNTCPIQSSLSSTASSDDGAKESKDDFAASFVCESLPDDSVVSCGEEFEKHWVFRNEGGAPWDENTKLHLLDETCDPSVATGSSLSEWGATTKSVVAPPLTEGQTGVVCVKHVAPAHSCIYQSSWKLSHKNSPFGPRVWCNLRVKEEMKNVVNETSKSLESFVDVVELEPETTEPVKNEENGKEQQSVVPPSKVPVRDDEGLHSIEDHEQHPNLNVMSFDMGDISDGAKYIDSTSQEVPHFNPAVSSVKHEDTEEEFMNEREEAMGASVDGEAYLSDASASPVLVSPPSETAAEHDEEPKTLENEADDVQEEDEEAEEDDKDVEEIENFTEQTIEPQSFSSDDESDNEEEVKQQSVVTTPKSVSEDSESVDFAIEEPPSLASLASFVVVPLPDCFDVNKPLNGSQYLGRDEDEETSDFNSKADEIDTEPNYPPEDSDSEPESQPPSVTPASEFKSEDSSIAVTTPKTVDTPEASLPPAAEDEAPPSGGATPQPESVDNESLTERIHKEFDEFLANPEHPVDLAPPRKIPMNQMPGAIPKVTLYAPEPKPVPVSVTNIDAAYRIPNSESAPSFPPFEQGWRRNPIAVPPSVTNTDPWPEARPTPAPRSPLVLPKPQSMSITSPIDLPSALPSVPFAVASPSESITGERPLRYQRPPSPQIAIADDFYPIGTHMPGSNVDPEPEDYDIFRTPPPSPTPLDRDEVELGPLDQLYEMGFHDIDLNRNIFESCERDLSRTVQALVLRAEADQRYNETA